MEYQPRRSGYRKRYTANLIMYVLTVVAVTTEQHADHGRIGGAYVACWIDRDTEEQAVTVAHDMIVADNWDVLRTEEISIVTDADYDGDDEYRQYYEQALIDKAVLVFNVYPRFPVYYVTFEITPTSNQNSANLARAWIANEAVDDEYDPMEPDFWSGDRLTKAVSLAADAIAGNGYDVIRIIDQGPCSCDDSSDDCQFFDDAEEDGLCLVFVHDQPA